MVKTARIVEPDLLSKLDDDFVRDYFSGLNENIGIIFACTKDNWRANESWSSKGWKYYRIVLPYEEVVAMSPEQVRQWMLQLAKERLGLNEKKPALAVS